MRPNPVFALLKETEDGKACVIGEALNAEVLLNLWARRTSGLMLSDEETKRLRADYAVDIFRVNRYLGLRWRVRYTVVLVRNTLHGRVDMSPEEVGKGLNCTAYVPGNDKRPQNNPRLESWRLLARAYLEEEQDRRRENGK